ncbi:MAG: hypothetical protein GY898_05620 [Proteobacteria bacterium]|nr:hypothetical protein [Pseudomonadota bacterium]
MTLLTALALALLAAPASAAEPPPQPVDEDLKLADTHFGMHLGTNIATAGFGTGALAAGIHSFVLLGEGSGSGANLFLGLTLTSLGAASIISSATGAEGNVRYWRAFRASLEGASETERRLYREAEAERLRRAAINRAIGLAADGTFLGIGIALTLAPGQQPLGPALIINGAFILGLDIFKLVVDDQVHRAWLDRSETADAGYFTRNGRIKPRVRSFALVPLVSPDGRGGLGTGSAFAIGGTF